jgi:hypothetical protein
MSAGAGGKANMSKDEIFLISVMFNVVLLSIVWNYYEKYKKQQNGSSTTNK